MTPLLERRLVFVTGKGGVGRTTVAASLGLLASQRGKRTLVCEAEDKGDLARAYECGALGFRPREVSPRLWAMSMDTEAALREYLRLQLHLPVAGRIGPLARALDFVATAAPGVREILTVGKLCYEVRSGRYDLVVVDAAPTGAIVGQLAAPSAINDLVKVGHVRHETEWMLEILRDEAMSSVCIVAIPEEMPVSEAIELAGRVRAETVLHVGAVVANRVLPELFGRGEQEVFDVLRGPAGRKSLAAALGESDPTPVGKVLEAAALAATIRRLGAVHLERLRAALDPAVPLLYLPYLFSRAHGPRAIHRLATSLAEELGD